MVERLKLDENVPRDAQALLRAAGNDVHTVNDEGLAGGPDSSVLDACLSEGRVLVTLDLDIADIRQYPPSTHRGIRVLRPATQSIDNTLSALKGTLALLGKEPTMSRLRLASVLQRACDEARALSESSA